MCQWERGEMGILNSLPVNLFPASWAVIRAWFCNAVVNDRLIYCSMLCVHCGHGRAFTRLGERKKKEKKNKIGAGANSASRCLLMAPWLDLLFTSACQQHNGRKTCQCDDHAHSTWSLALPHAFLATAVKAMQNRLLEEKTSVFNGTNDLHCGQSA